MGGHNVKVDGRVTEYIPFGLQSTFLLGHRVHSSRITEYTPHIVFGKLKMKTERVF
jgi:hypothetical protein